MVRKLGSKGWTPNEPTLALVLAIKKKLEKSIYLDGKKVVFDPPSYRCPQGQSSPEAAYCKSIMVTFFLSLFLSSFYAVVYGISGDPTRTQPRQASTTTMYYYYYYYYYYYA